MKTKQIVMMSVVYAEWHRQDLCAECRYAECQSAIFKVEML